MQIFKAWQTAFEPLHVTTAAAKLFRDLNTKNLWEKALPVVDILMYKNLWFQKAEK
jgi:hypothetical protein